MYKFGAIKSPADPRDYIYSQIIKAEVVPPAFFLPEVPVRDQGKFGTCVGFAAAGVKDIQESINYPSRGVQTSPLFVYSECKKADGIPTTEGTYPRIAMKVLKDIGVCKERTFPYAKLTDKIKIPATNTIAQDEAKTFKIGAYAKIQTVDEIKQAISKGSPVLAGVIVADNFITCEEGFIDTPKGYIRGGHAITLTGYDDDLSHAFKGGKVIRKGFFKFRNSWGCDWGINGCGWLPYDFVNYREASFGMTFFNEAWSSVDIILPPEQAKEVILWVGSRTAKVDGETVFLDQEPVIDPKNNRTLIPLRFLSEVLNYKVDWNATERKIILRR